MSIGAISSISSISSPLNQILAAPAVAPVSAPSTFNSDTPSPAPASTPTPTESPQVQGPTQAGQNQPTQSQTQQAQATQTQAASTSSLVATLITGYSTTVGKTHYNGSVDQLGSDYTASIENLVGSTVSGSSVLSAETNLGFRIDVIV